MKHLNKQCAAIASILIFSIGLMLSSNVFAAKPADKTYATEEALNTEIRDRTAIDANLQRQIDLLNTKYAIGDSGPAGGIVFYVTDFGFHGLEAAPVDQDDGTGAQWGCMGEVAGANGTDVGTGAQNTAAILAKGCSFSPIAAELANDYDLNEYTDWFLPSKDEWNQMYYSIGLGAPAPLTNKGGFANATYWSSSEVEILASDFVWSIDEFGNLTKFAPKQSNLRVRAVRAF